MSTPVLFHEASGDNSAPPLRFIPEREEEGVDFKEFFKIVADGRWLILLAILLSLAGAALYFIASKPLFEANMLIHVEEETNKEQPRTTFNEMGSMFTLKTTASSEIELVRSRLVISRALDSLDRYVQTKPQYFPLVGEWLVHRIKQTVIPDGYGGYAWENDKIDVTNFIVPDVLLNEKFTIDSKGNGLFTVHNKKGKISSEGQVGVPLRIDSVFGKIELLVSHMEAAPNVSFQVKRFSRLALIEDVQKNMHVKELGKQSAVLRVALTGDDAYWLHAVLSKIGEQYIEQNAARKTQEANKALAFLNKQLPELKQQLEDSEARYNHFRNVKGTVDLGEEAKSDLQQIVAAKARKAELEQKRNELLIRFTPNHPVLVGVDTQLREVGAEIRNLNLHIKSLPLVEQDLLKLTRDLKVNTELYMSLLNTARQLRLVTVSATSNVRLVDMPMMPELPVSAGWKKVFGIGILGGMVAGIAGAFLRNSLRRGVEDPVEIEQMLNLPVYAAIPHSKLQKKLQAKSESRSRGQPLLAKHAANNETIESLRKFRSVLQYASSRNKNNVSLIVSPTAANGKSFISANLAVLLGTSSKKILLIDADLRNGDLHAYFNVRQEGGLTEALSGTADIDQLIRVEVSAGVDLITSGALPRESELLLTPALPSLLRRLAPRYDMVLINGAPILEVSDSLAIGPHAGAIYVVARAGISTLREIGDTLRVLRQSGLTAKGCLLNGVKGQSHTYGSRYEYRYGRQLNVQYLSGNALKSNAVVPKAESA